MKKGRSCRRRLWAAAVLAIATLAGCTSESPGSGTAPAQPAPFTSTPTAGGPTCPAGVELAGSPGKAFKALEQEYDARMGVHAIDTETESVVSHRAHRRFPHASTIKALLAGAVLEELDRQQLDRRVRWSGSELVAHSPVTEQHVDHGLTIRGLVDAALTVSDNTAANLLLGLLGGPAALEDALRRLGDNVTSVDRWEPDLNVVAPGDTRDTSTPHALAQSLRAYALTDVLTHSDRALLRRAMEQNTTGDDLIRGGVPPRWQVADKTGSAAYGARNDIAVVTPPGRAPTVIAILSSRDRLGAETDDALIASATEVVMAALCGSTG